MSIILINLRYLLFQLKVRLVSDDDCSPVLTSGDEDVGRLSFDDDSCPDYTAEGFGVDSKHEGLIR